LGVGGTYAWSNAATTEDITISTDGVYTVTVTGSNGCKNTANETAAIKAVPSITLTSTSPGCGSANINVGGGDTYTFSGAGTTTPVITFGAPNPISARRNVTSSGSYTVTVTNSQNCTATQSVNIVVNPAVTISLAKVVPTCGPAVFTATSGGGTGTVPLTYAWSSNFSNVNGNVAELKRSGNYAATVTDPSTGCIASIPAQFDPSAGFVFVPVTYQAVNSNPELYAVTGGGSYCVGGTGVAIGLSNSETGVNYQLKNGTVDVGTAVAGTGTAITFGNQTAGTYTVVATNTAGGCNATMTGSATATSMNCLGAVLSGTQTIITKDPANLVVTVTGGTSPHTIVYNNGVSDITVNNYVSGTNIVVTPTLSTTYTLISFKDATNTNGVASGSAIVTTLADNTPPTITSADDIIDACAVPNPLPTSSKPTITDNAQTPPTLTLVGTVSGSLTSALVALKYTKYYIRTWKATDNNGNTATKTQNVYLRDNVAPTVTCKNVSINVGTADITINAAMLLNLATDNCVANPTIGVAKGTVTTGAFTSSVKHIASTIPVGQSTVQVSLRATDGSNSGFCTATVTFTKNVVMVNGNNNNSNNNAINQNAISDAKLAANTQVAEKQLFSMKCYPNPFSDDLNINYHLTQDANNVTLKVYDNQGRLMTTHEMNEQRAGNYDMHWNLSDLQAGMYHICLEIDGKCKKMERVIMMR
jgi:Secretion system C-terminal sorting domain